MMTELQSQLSVIRKQHIQATPLHQGRASLFLTPTEAAAVDTSAVYDAAVSGLSTLRQYDTRFEGFFDNLLHPSSVDVQRELKTVEENKVLDSEIHSILRHLSLFSHEPSCHLVLEYLIRRYRIHELNADALLRCMLASHDSKIFARVVQLCTIEDSVWEFLGGVKKSGSPLPRAIIVQRALRDSSLLDVLCQVVQSALDVATSQVMGVTTVSQAEIVKGADRILSFFTATVVEMADERSFDDAKMRSIYVFLLEGLRQKKGSQQQTNGGETVEQWRRAACMILVQLCRKTSFAKPLMKSLSSALAEAFVQAVGADSSRATKLGGEMLSTMIVLAQQQKIKISPAFLARIFLSTPSSSASSDSDISSSGAVFIKLFGLMGANYDVSALSTEIAAALSGELSTSKSDQASSLDFVSGQDVVKICKALIAGGVVDAAGQRSMLMKLLRLVCDAKSSFHSSPDWRNAAVEVSRDISQRSPLEFDECVREASHGDESASDALGRFLKDLFEDKKYRLPDSEGVGLLLSLSSAIPQVKVQACKTFAATIALDCESTQDVVGICQAALGNLSSHDEEIAMAAWRAKVVARIAQHVAPAELHESSQAAFKWWSNVAVATPKSGCRVLAALVSSLREAPVLKALQAAEDEEGLSWLFATLVGVALGAVRSRYTANNAASRDETFSAVFLPLQQEALRSLEEAGNACLPLLKGIKAKEGATSEEVVLTVVKTVGKNITDSNSTVLTDLAAASYETLASDRDVGAAIASLDLLLGVAGEVLSAKKASAGLAQSLLRAACPLLLLTIEAMDKSASAEHLIHLVPLVKSFLALVPRSAPAAASSTATLEALVSAATGPVLASSLSLRTLVKLLECKRAQFLSLVGPCVASGSYAHPAEAFLQLSQGRSDSGAVRASAAAFAVEGAPLLVSSSVRAAALQGLATFVASIAARPLGAQNALSVADSLALLTILPIVIASCCDDKDVVRKAGLAVAKRIVALNGKSVLSLDKDTKARFANTSVGSIIAICKILSDREGTIALDRFAASAGLVAELFKHADLQQLSFVVYVSVGWAAPQTSQPFVELVASASIDASWSFVHSLLASAPAAGLSSQGEEMCRALVKCLSSFGTASAKTKSDVVSWIVEFLPASNGDSQSAAVVRAALLDLFPRGVFESCDADSKDSLYAALMKEQLTRPGSADVLQAIGSVRVALSQPLRLLKDGLTTFREVFTKLVKAGADAMLVDGEGEEGEDSAPLVGVSAPLQRLSALMEAIVPSLSRASAAQAAELGEFAALLLDALELINHPSLKSVMIVEFSKALVIDASFHCLSIAGQSIVSTGVDSGVSKTPKKGAKSTSAAGDAAYPATRVEKDVHVVLNCLGSAKLSQVQNSALSLLQCLVALNPSAVFSSTRVLGELLSTSSAAVQLGREGLVENILKTFVGMMPAQGSSASSVYVAQDLLQALCERFQFMPHYRRSALTKLALKTLRSEQAVAATVGVLLAHTYTSYEFSSNASNETLNENTAAAQPLLLLSKAAHRKANKELRTSVPEEFFSLAVEVLVSRSPDLQINVVVALLKAAKNLLDLAFGQELEESEDRLPVSVEKVRDYCSHLLSVRARAANASAPAEASGDGKGHCAALAVLLLEYILEVLEHKQFHAALVTAVDSSAAIAASVQNNFLELADYILQLQSYASSVVQGLGAFSRGMGPVVVRLEASVLRLSPKALSGQVNSWCYEGIRVLQRLVDGPTFVAILQELIAHEQIEVRQKALLILGDRLEGMTLGGGKNEAEVSLYLDLNSTLRQVVRDLLAALQSGKDGEQHKSVGLAQSALMCLDVLARFLSKRPEWVKDLVSTLTEVMALITALSALVDPQPAAASSSKKKAVAAVVNVETAVEHLKLLGSAFLCCGTLCGQLGPKALGQLAGIMTSHLDCVEKHGQHLLREDLSSASEEAVVLSKTRVLFVRSVLSSLTVIVSEVSSFVHPYLRRLLTLALPLHGVAHLRDIETDVDRCLSAIAAKIPPRLSVPALLDTTPAVLATGHNAAGRFAELLAEVCINLDRSTVKAHLNSLSSMATLLLDYRRVFGDQSAEADEVDGLIAEAVVELCLKLTESELKSFLGQLAEWRDASDEQDWRQHSRAVAFYALVEALSEKLRSLFMPSMGAVWANACELLGLLPSVVAASAGGSGEAKKDKKDKKRKHEEHAEDPSQPAAAAGDQRVVEVIALTSKVLSCIKMCCSHDTVGFLDEHRYEAAMPSCVALLNTRAAFVNDDGYLSFAEDFLTPCLTALAVTVGKDLLWKPLNHKVLLATRDKRKAVRMAAVKTLHQLFSEAGEEYLLLLPECLPFLSELMEDDAQEVVALTSEAIKFMEELSGESLDSYLQ